MSPKSEPVGSPWSVVSIDGPERRTSDMEPPTRDHVSRFTQDSSPALNPQPSTPNHAFTLIEIMVVVAIMGIVMSMSVPIVYKTWRKAPMRKAVSDVVEVFSHARARAIMQGVTTEVVIHPKENRLGLGTAGPPRPAGEAGAAPEISAPAASGSGLSAQLSDSIIIETLDINMSGVEFNDVEVAKIRFYPNGISDEMRMILFDGRERYGIELEITTGLATVVRDPLREWTRR
jgi:prepilin-type N-terminal cleavage/methylation domain-containing protein